MLSHAAASRPPGLAAEKGTLCLVPQLTQRVVKKSPLRGYESYLWKSCLSNSEESKTRHL